MEAHIRKQAGYTLVEVLIAMGIFSIGIMAVAGMQTRGVIATTNARVVTEAQELAEARSEFYQGLLFYPDYPYINLPPEKRFKIHEKLAQGEYEKATGRFTITSRIMDNTPLERVKNIYTHSLSPSKITISKTIAIVVHETRNPGKPLAEIEMIKVWETDL